MPAIPKTRSPDSTLALLRRPYRFISRRCLELGTDLFETRLLMRRTICMRGAEAAELFYDTERFRRAGSAPVRVQRTLFGRGGVQGLDDDAHRHRKAMFMSVMTPGSIERLVGLFEHAWRGAMRDWEGMERVVLYDELQPVITRAVCAWAGVPLADGEVGRRAWELRMMFDGAGAVGARHWKSRAARMRGERWASGLIEDARAGRITLEEGSPAAVVAGHRDLDGRLLNPHDAAVELLNLLRPTAAVSVYITQMAHALRQYPGRRPPRGADRGQRLLFVQEVRRFYPFFPAVVAVVRKDFEWRGYRFTAGRRAMLDLYGTTHDPRLWEDPDRFHPQRFVDRPGSPFDMIPQGGGDHFTGHRCAGEWITISLMDAALRLMTEEMDYTVPDQDVRINERRMPALPRDGMVLTGVRTRVAAAAGGDVGGAAACPHAAPERVGPGGRAG